MPMPNLQQANQALTDSLYETKKAAHGAAQDMEQLSKSVFSYGKALVAYTGFTVLKESLKWGFEQLRTQRQAILAAQTQQNLLNKRLDSLRNELAAMRASGAFTRTELEQQQMLVDFFDEKAKASEKDLNFRRQIFAIVEKEGINAALTLTYLLLVRDAWKHTLNTVHEYNRAFITARSDSATRYDLLQRTLRTQEELGASTEDMADAARHLVEYGNHLTPSFRTNLKVVTEMKVGLGVAANTAAEMAIVFTRQLRTGAEQVADAISMIAANTGLAAQKATQFATEIGRALRAMGPGLRTEATGITKLIGTMAGRIEALGGNAESVVSVFKSLTAGSERGIMLRQMVGVTPGMMTTQQGVVNAMKGLDAMIRMRVNAPEGTNQYLVQLEQLSEQVGISSYDLQNLQEVMRDWNKTTNQTRSVADAYREQTMLMGKSWEQIKTSLGTFIVEALTPFAKILQPIMKGVADLTKAITSWEILGVKPLVTVFTVGIPIAAGFAIFSLGKLVWSIWKLAKDASIVSTILDAKGLGMFKGMGPRALWSFANTPIGLSRLGPGMLGPAATTGLGAGSLATMGAGIIAAGAAGYAVGTVADKLLNKMPVWAQLLSPLGMLKQISRVIGDWSGRDERAQAEAKKWIDANAGGSPLAAARAAAAAIVQQRIGAGSAAEAARLTDIAVQKFATLGWDETRTRANVTGMAFQEAKAQVMRGAFSRMTFATEGDKAESARLAAALRNLQTEEAMLRLQQQSNSMQQIQTDAAKAQMKSISEGSNRVNWDLAPPLDRNTNAGAYPPK